jgi:hypothetical protein
VTNQERNNMNNIIEEREAIHEDGTLSPMSRLLPVTPIEGMQRWSKKDLTPAMASRVITLEREAPHLVDLAKTANVDIQYLGIAPLPNGPRVFSGAASDWVLGPATAEDAHYIPRAQRRKLERLEESGFHMPTLFIAHEIPKGNVPQTDGSPVGTTAGVSEAVAKKAVGPIPPPAGTVEIGERLSERAHQVFSALGKAVPIIGAVAAAPFLLAGAVASAALDPIIFGVIPAVSTAPGEPAAWFVLARWDW